MVTAGIAALTLGLCTAVRRRLNRSGQEEARSCAGGRVEIKTCWNGGAAFGLPVSRRAVTALSAGLLGILWMHRKDHPVGTGLVLGGGASNLLERLRQGKVCDYLRFPKAPACLRRYVFNLADFAILFGSVTLAFRKKKQGSGSCRK